MNNQSSDVVHTLSQHNELSYTIETSFDDLDYIREEWDRFVLMVNGGIYFSYDWCKIWWNHYSYKRKLKIFLFRKNDKLVGIVPVLVDKIWMGVTWVRLAKLIGSDSTLSVLKIPVLQYCAGQIYTILLEDMLVHSGVDLLWIGPVSGDDETVDDLRDNGVANNSTYKIYDQTKSCHTLFALPDQFDEYLRQISKSKKRDYKQGMNRLQKSFNASYHVIDKPQEILDEFDNFYVLHNKQWQGENKLGHFFDWPGATDFHREIISILSQMDRVRITKVVADENNIALQYCFFFGGVNHWFLPARVTGSDWNRFQLGTLMVVHLVNVSIDAKIKEIDGGQGHYDYKLKLGARECPLHSVLVGKDTFIHRVKCNIFIWMSRCINTVYYKIWFCKLAPKCPAVLRRPLWKIWIRTRMLG